MSGELVRVESQAVIQQDRIELTVDEIVAKVAKVREVASKVMKEDIHFGTIPGTPKPTLFKAGGEILALTFRLAPKYEGERNPIDLGHGHREYIIRCDLYHIHTGEFYGSGIGSCSTMEGKYRYRPGPITPTGRPVPKEYWDARNSDPAKAKTLLGGHGFQAKKVDGTWEIVEQGETIENPNPADQYNTALKMAGKRAYVDAILKATAASEVYTQDLEDMEDVPVVEKSKPKPSPAPQPEASQPPVDMEPTCKTCGGAMKFIKEGIAKTGKNAGKPYSAFWICSADKFSIKDKDWRVTVEQMKQDLSVPSVPEPQEQDPF